MGIFYLFAGLSNLSPLTLANPAIHLTSIISAIKSSSRNVMRISFYFEQDVIVCLKNQCLLPCVCNTASPQLMTIIELKIYVAR